MIVLSKNAKIEFRIKQEKKEKIKELAKINNLSVSELILTLLDTELIARGLNVNE